MTRPGTRMAQTHQDRDRDCDLTRQRSSFAHFSTRLIAIALLALVPLACAHAPPPPPPPPPPAPKPPPPPDPRILAAALSDEARALLRSEGELFWQRWTTGAGASPASAAAGHEHLYEKASLELLASAEAKSDSPDEKHAFALLRASLWPQAIAKASGAAEGALEQARAQLAFAAPGDAKAERSERDLDRLLTDEPSAQKRAAIADSEAAAAAGLAQLALARDRAEEDARVQLGLPSRVEMLAVLHGRSPDDLAQLAEATLLATQEVAAKAVADAAERTLGQPLDRLRRADLPRLVRASEADAELQAGRGWENARATFAGLNLDPLALPPSSGTLRVDGEPAPVKASRPLALLVDPPSDVRLSLKSTGGFDEQRALLHEAARALGGALTRAPRWELAQLGDGSAAEGVAWLAESLSGDPTWLRERTGLRGQALDDLVHTEATRRVLAARRAAALVLFEVQRATVAQTVEAQDELYRSLLTRATFAQHGEHEGGRWPLETDGWMKAAVTLRAALLGASLAMLYESHLKPATAVAPANAPASSPSPSSSAPPSPSSSAPPSTSTPRSPSAGPTQLVSTPNIDTQNMYGPVSAVPPATASAPAGSPSAPAAASPGHGASSNGTSATSAMLGPAPGWWHAPSVSDSLQQIWSRGRALTAEEAAKSAGVPFDAKALALFIEMRLAYAAPEKPPAAQRPDYKFMQGDHRPRRRRHHKAQ